MIRSRMALVAALAVLGLVSPARAEICDEGRPFQRFFEQDVSGGYYAVGEDAQISTRFRDNAAGVVADLRVIRPYRTKEFGSGVAFWICDAKNANAMRVLFRDTVGESTLTFGVQRFDLVGNPPNNGAYVVLRQLSLPKNEVARVRLQKNAAGDLVVRVDGETFSLKPGFKIHSIVVQIYCAKGWARFLDDELLS